MIPSTVTAPPMSTTEAVTAEIYIPHCTILWGKNPYNVFLTVQQTVRFQCSSPALSHGRESTFRLFLLPAIELLPMGSVFDSLSNLDGWNIAFVSLENRYLT